ncbi:hypothetical protein HCK21_000237 [Listeria monocytogenes]|uniref:Uncharacterized protein n=1 Tax=Listeria monocytogenes serotype 1/2a TaxID=1906951 RepID=A0A9P2DRS6_LISMN|nr:hypothetical protein [Listeria monocytogenes]EAF3075336.1 hypothetical protein [Listeria monocytogenes serotype 1/2a]EAF5052099.1 hypothetical protein [Listeria monocytogenes]EEP7691377.1 hypothetical protein [Listeria monocytogenes]EEP7715388.1 hypothetical protein [Listeria monocytogenes]
MNKGTEQKNRTKEPNKRTEQKNRTKACRASFTSKSIEILPFVPYFSHDFFGLGSSPKDVIIDKAYVPE